MAAAMLGCASWTLGETAWQQPPDYATGINVLDSLAVIDGLYPDEVMLADSFTLTQARPLTGLRVWGACSSDAWWLSYNILPVTWAVYANIPAQNSPTGYAMPGDLLWWHYEQYNHPTPSGTAYGGIYNPRINATGGAASMIRTVDVSFPSSQGPFLQPGQYWLAVYAHGDVTNDQIVNVDDLGIILNNTGDGWAFGWRTSTTTSGSPALWRSVGATSVYLRTWLPPTGGWDRLTYPAGHPLPGQPMDLAFEIIAPPPGDATGDDIVNVDDLGILATNYGQAARNWSSGDFTGDTVVNVDDLGVLASSYGTGGQVPEPGIMSLVVLSFALRRRH
jgi:hypothetical protein